MLLLVSVWIVAKLTPVDITALPIGGITYQPDFDDYVHIMIRNSLVLALHALACVAGLHGRQLDAAAGRRTAAAWTAGCTRRPAPRPSRS